MEVPVQNIPETSREIIRSRDQWSSQYEFLLALLGGAIGLGNMWRFPYLCYKHGGGAFVVCYLLAAVTVGIPYFFLEMALGQFMQAGILGIWKICPLFKGIGWAMVVICFYSNLYYIVILAWALLFMFNSVKLPWDHCDPAWSTAYCVPALCRVNCSKFPDNETISSVEEYWERRLLQITKGIEDLGSLQWELVGTLLLMWIICYFCLWKGVKWTGKVVHFTVAAPYILLLIVLCKVVILPGAIEGIKFYLVPKMEKLLDIKVWFAALSQVLYSMGVGYGALAALGSYNPYHNNIQRQMLIAASIEISTSIFIGFVVFSTIGFMSDVQKKPIDKVVKSGTELAFIVYPTAVLELPFSPFWAILFFLIIITIGIDSEFCCIEGFTTALMDEFQHYVKNRRKLFLLGVCFLTFLPGLLCVTRGGMYIFNLVDNYAVAGWSVFTAVLLEGSVVSYIYDLEDMLGFRPTSWWKICWFAISPIIVIVIIIVQLVEYRPIKYHNYSYPAWANGLGWLMSFSSIICIPLYMIYYIVRTRGSLTQRLKKSITPSYKLSDSKLISKQQIEMQSSKEQSPQELRDPPMKI